ncbi:hypothetical protein [Ammoniphilus sp. 3BR4]|uniref:hypothetical protein n=1 Tax=Ammoniphilus sp. 3BR4 TaxID=3158265 RepID=UPI003465ED0E
MQLFEIKYEIFEDDVAEFRNINVSTFDADYGQIYGLLTIVLGGYEFIPYPPEDLPLSAKRVFSELILRHFELLIDVLSTIKTNDYVALKYIENPFTWLEIKVQKDSLEVTELEFDEYESLDSLIITDKSYFYGARYGSFKQVIIPHSEFEMEIRKKVKAFIREINSINPNLLKSKYFTHLLNFK